MFASWKASPRKVWPPVLFQLFLLPVLRLSKHRCDENSPEGTDSTS